MKKYIFMRVLRSLLSIFLVTTLTYTIIYTMVPRKLIFKQDTNYNKIATTPDKRDNYENTVMNGWAISSTTIPKSCKKERARWTHL